jgi:hypothetical protein
MSTITNGYKIPGAKGGTAVWKALFNVLNRPGLTQKEQLVDCCQFSSLNESTAGWITSPSDKSPAGKLWDRRKEGVFRLYPNEWTEKAFNACPNPDVFLTNNFKKVAKNHYGDEVVFLRPGDLVKVRIGSEWVPGVFVNWVVSDSGKIGPTGLFDYNQRRADVVTSFHDISPTHSLVPYFASEDSKLPRYSVQCCLNMNVLIGGVTEEFTMGWTRLMTTPSKAEDLVE